jgi:pimeloyl-ACP methyl ester carboxylesterase
VQHHPVRRDRARRLTQALLACLVTLTLAACNFMAEAAPARPGLVVKLPDGRSMNLMCTGRGKPTVLLEAGWGASSRAWTKVQPQLSRLTQVCSYDRAGYAYSDPGPLPRDGATIARDLEAALAAARIGGPYILVGHSAGGLYVRLFAARHLAAVKGLVLLDPTVETRVATPGSKDGLDGPRARVRRCLEAALASRSGTASDAADPCVKDADAHGRQVAANPDTWRNQISELDNLYGRTSDEVMRIGDLLHDVPIYVITASDTANNAPKIGYDRPQSVWELQHMRLAMSSSHGAQRTVYSSHLVMIDRPEVVVDAVAEMVRAARAGRPPEALPPSEGAETGEEAPFAPAPAVTK